MTFFLRLTDRPRYELRRLTLELCRICSLVPAATFTKDRFAAFSMDINAARPLMKRAGANACDLLAGLESSGACLEKVFLDMRVHSTAPDENVRETLSLIAAALKRQAEFIRRPSDKTPLAASAQNTALASRNMTLARRASAADPQDFIANLKFSRIYSGLETVIRAVEDYAALLAMNL
ncbi:MAG TPA: hypothetical protein PL037_10030, partial [Elusimicrobiales bacterium]|nr:hypothetical protein [Elusimicrobiales bacterium]